MDDKGHAVYHGVHYSTRTFFAHPGAAVWPTPHDRPCRTPAPPDGALENPPCPLSGMHKFRHEKRNPGLFLSGVDWGVH